MGIVNMTPDSFSRDGLIRRSKPSVVNAVHFVEKLLRDGADIIDIGGESTRPGAQRVTVKDEIDRIIPTITAIAKMCPVPISVDTYKPGVAARALDAGATILNNIMGINPNLSLLKMAKNYNAAIILMHIQGTPRTMQKNFHYKNLIEEISASLKLSIETALDTGILPERIVVDPGIGFGKSAEHNLEIINRLDQFGRLQKPILVGPSRKSFIGKVLNQEIDNRFMGTTACVCASIINGAHIVRVHDVKPLKEIIAMADAILRQEID